MTRDNQSPRKRRRRRRRGQGGAPASQPAGVNGNGPSPGNEAVPQQNRANDGGEGFGRQRRRRSRRRGGRSDHPMEREAAPYTPPVDVPPGELTEVMGVLYV